MSAGLKLDAYLPYRLSVASNAVSELISRAYQDRFGLSVPQWRLICVLAEDGALTQGQLVARTVMDKVTVSRAAQGLVQRGLLVRLENGKDGRSHILAMAPEGEALYAHVAPLAVEFERALLDQWSAEDVERLHEQLKRLQHTAAVLAGLR